jgi:hypothetical protein
MRGISRARPTTGHATALPSPAMNARHLMAIPPETRARLTHHRAVGIA